MRKEIILLSVLASVMLVSGIGSRDFWNPDEPRYALVAQEMLQRGDWLVPHVNGLPYSDKPPVFFWLIALFSLIAGKVTVVSARLPSILCSIGSVVITYLFGCRLLDRRAGVLAALLLLTSVKFAWHGGMGHIDPVLSFFVLSALYLFWIGYSSHCCLKHWLAIFFLMGLATITKGPVGFLIPLGTVVVFLLISGDVRGLREIPWGWGILVFVGTVALWLLPVCLVGSGSYLYDLFWRQNVSRYLTPWGHNRPWYYFLKVFPFEFLPSTLFIPLGIYTCWKRRWFDKKVLFLAVWFFFPFIFFSCTVGKRGQYLLPCYPAWSLFLGMVLTHWSEIITQKRRDRAFACSVYTYVTLFLVMAVAVVVGICLRSSQLWFLSLWSVVLWSVWIGLIGVVIWYMVSRRHEFSGMPVLISIFALPVFTIWYIYVFFLPQIDTIRSVQPFCHKVVRASQSMGRSIEDLPVACFRKHAYEQAYSLHLGRSLNVIKDLSTLDRFVTASGPRILIVDEEDLPEIDESLRNNMQLYGYYSFPRDCHLIFISTAESLPYVV